MPPRCPGFPDLFISSQDWSFINGFFGVSKHREGMGWDERQLNKHHSALTAAAKLMNTWPRA